ncbi:helix-turn-helix domain-containing protein [Sphingomonas sp. DBB INV C78]|uniref:helix-turn-helix domain-containing protein n=1 Tax=Sphingomonas sp. DBB INV C78 TaxID=3349434 RepID=UPI0036D3101A
MEGEISRAPAGSVRFACEMLDLALAMGVPATEILQGLNLAIPSGALRRSTIEGLDPNAVKRLGSRLAHLLSRYSSLAEGREPLRPPDWQVILYCLLAGRTLRDAILHAAQAFEAIDGRCGKMALFEKGAVAEVRIDSLRPAPTRVGCVVDLHGLASIHGLIEWLIGSALPLRSIHLGYTGALCAPLDPGFLPYPLVIDAPWTGFRLASTWLDYPVVRSLGELSDRPPRSFLFGMDAQAANLPLPDRVRRFAIETLRSRARLPSFAEVAAHLGASEPTLRRHLAHRGASYRLIKASCRRELGLELLRQPHLSIEDISARLDFCDADAFREAFREWFGKPPGAYRRDLDAMSDQPAR